MPASGLCFIAPPYTIFDAGLIRKDNDNPVRCYYQRAMFGDQRRGEIARNLLAVRAARTSSFPSELFDEHAWNMLLHLFSALTENETISEEDLIRQSSMSTAVGRRWLAHLVKDGQIEAREDGGDVCLTPNAIANMRIFLDQANEIHGTPQAF